MVTDRLEIPGNERIGSGLVNVKTVKSHQLRGHVWGPPRSGMPRKSPEMNESARVLFLDNRFYHDPTSEKKVTACQSASVKEGFY